MAGGSLSAGQGALPKIADLAVNMAASPGAERAIRDDPAHAEGSAFCQD
jgi:hypothetical protein